MALILLFCAFYVGKRTLFIGAGRHARATLKGFGKSIDIAVTNGLSGQGYGFISSFQQISSDFHTVVLKILAG